MTELLMDRAVVIPDMSETVYLKLVKEDYYSYPIIRDYEREAVKYITDRYKDDLCILIEMLQNKYNKTYRTCALPAMKVKESLGSPTGKAEFFLIAVPDQYYKEFFAFRKLRFSKNFYIFQLPNKTFARSFLIQGELTIDNLRNAFM